MDRSRFMVASAVVALAATAGAFAVVRARRAPIELLDPLIGDDPTPLFRELAAGHPGGAACTRYGTADVDPARAAAVAQALIDAGLADRPMVELARAWGIREDQAHVDGIGAEFQDALVARGGPYVRLLGALNRARWSAEREQLLLADLPTPAAAAAVPADRTEALRKIWAGDPGLFGLAAERAFVPVLATAVIAPRLERVLDGLGQYAIRGGTLPASIEQLRVDPADLRDFSGEMFAWQTLADGSARLTTAHGVSDAPQVVEVPPVARLCTRVDQAPILEADLNADGLADRVVVVPDLAEAVVLRGCGDGAFAFAGIVPVQSDLTVGAGAAGGWANLRRGGDNPVDLTWNGVGWWPAPE